MLKLFFFIAFHGSLREGDEVVMALIVIGWYGDRFVFD